MQELIYFMLWLSLVTPQVFHSQDLQHLSQCLSLKNKPTSFYSLNFANFCPIEDHRDLTEELA